MSKIGNFRTFLKKMVTRVRRILKCDDVIKLSMPPKMDINQFPLTLFHIFPYNFVVAR